MPTITENAINPAGVGNRKGTIAPTAIMQAVMTVSIFGRPIRSASGPAARQQTSPDHQCDRRVDEQHPLRTGLIKVQVVLQNVQHVVRNHAAAHRQQEPRRQRLVEIARAVRGGT